ncbi:hypothetical protein CEXT_635021 [Caerostris extrusa]|uniref:Uncharacterized protein n=1 Tax=Caerostris extrusa TaxID=172846 RepID=A0AAV4UP01_CAEEX|nr:hypothetical protein CEXT_635021 [Caerostris extrusa]
MHKFNPPPAKKQKDALTVDEGSRNGLHDDQVREHEVEHDIAEFGPVTQPVQRHPRDYWPHPLSVSRANTPATRFADRGPAFPNNNIVFIVTSMNVLDLEVSDSALNRNHHQRI